MNLTNPAFAHAIRHRQGIESAVANRTIGAYIEKSVVRSWRRCLEGYSLDPAQPRKPSVVDATELQRRRAALGNAAAVIRATMMRLSATFDHTLCAIFTDAQGVILFYAAAPAFAERARGLRAGAVWSESEQGTNGMGTCLAEREPVIIEKGDHFLAQNTGLTCFAMPVFQRGQLIGALDISCHDVPPRGPMLALLDLAVLDIENRLVLQQASADQVLCFSPSREELGTALEGIVSFDRDGRITGANRAAVRLLGAQAQEQVFGRPVEHWLHIDRDDRLDARSTVFRCRPVVEDPKREYYYCRARAAEEHIAHRPVATEVRPVRTAVDAAERRALLDALRCSDGNVSAAARSLGIGRKTLYRKLAKHRLRAVKN